MRVLVCSNHAEMIGGADKAFLNQIRCLRSRGIEATGFASVDRANIGTRLLQHVEEIPIQLFEKPKQSWTRSRAFVHDPCTRAAFDKVLDAFKPDIVHFHIFHGVLTNALPAACVVRGIPYVFTAHEYRLLCPNALMCRNDGAICEACASRTFKVPAIRHRCVHRSFLRSTLATLECYARDRWYKFLRHCGHVLFVSRFIQDLHVKYRPELIGKSSVIYNFCELEPARWVANSVELTRKMNGPILYVGRLSREKNAGFMVDLAANMPERRFLVAGSGEAEAEMRSKVAALRLENIELLGYRGAREIQELIDQSAFSVIPSTWYENNPLAMLESLARGTPVFGTAHGGVPEVLTQVDPSLVFDPFRADAVRDVANRVRRATPDEYLWLSKRSLAVIPSLFSEQRYFDATMAVYDRVLTDGQASSPGRGIAR